MEASLYSQLANRFPDICLSSRVVVWPFGDNNGSSRAPSSSRGDTAYTQTNQVADHLGTSSAQFPQSHHHTTILQPKVNQSKGLYLLKRDNSHNIKTLGERDLLWLWLLHFDDCRRHIRSERRANGLSCIVQMHWLLMW